MTATQMMLPMVIDKSVRDERGRKVRPERHTKKIGEDRILACGHMTEDGDYIQFPLLVDSFLAVTDCKTCRDYVKVNYRKRGGRWAKKTPVSNTGVNSALGASDDNK